MANATEHPLAELLEHLRRDGDVPAAWVKAHDPDESLRVLWDRERDPRVLFELHRRLSNRVQWVGAACACARLALELAPGHDARIARWIDTAEAAIGLIGPSADGFTYDGCSDLVADDAWRLVDELEAAGASSRLVAVAAAAAEAVTAGDEHAGDAVVIEAAASAVECAAEVEADASGSTERVFALVRARLWCPRLVQLRAAYQRV